jgi:hypothetical protein
MPLRNVRASADPVTKGASRTLSGIAVEVVCAKTGAVHHATVPATMVHHTRRCPILQNVRMTITPYPVP